MIVLAAAHAVAADIGAPSEAELLYQRLIPRGWVHFAYCWHREHDYYALRAQIAHTGVVWRREQLELQWEQGRDQRRETCLTGW
jgi:hypothetical protein